jgi:hypothetical protein
MTSKQARFGWLLAAWTVACGDATAPAAEAGDSSGGGEVCEPGYDGCPCVIATCLGALVCIDDVCSLPPGDASSSGAPSVDDTAPGSTTAPAEDSTSTGHADSDSSGSSEADTSSSESSTTAVVPDCVDAELACEGGELQTCVDERWQSTTCTEQCALTGYTSSGCADETSCACDGYLDTNCATGVAGFCYCLEYADAGTCTDDDRASYYGSCFEMTDPIVACFADYVFSGVVDCPSAFNGCL